MKKIFLSIPVLMLVVLAACNQRSADSNTETSTSVVVDSSDMYNSNDLKNLALAINAPDKESLQKAIDEIKNMDIKYWAIAVTIKTDNGLVEAIQKTTNADVKYTAFAMSGNDTTQTEQILGKINEADLKHLAEAYMHPSDAKHHTDEIKNARLKNLALSITASTPEDKAKYANAIAE